MCVATVSYTVNFTIFNSLGKKFQIIMPKIMDNIWERSIMSYSATTYLETEGQI